MKEYRPIRGRGDDGRYLSSRFDRVEAAELRRERADAGNCIVSDKHGPATHGQKCKRCFAVHRYGAVVVAREGLDNLYLGDRRHFDRRRFTKFPSAALAA